jgi:phosphatidylserine decarboxylase
MEAIIDSIRNAFSPVRHEGLPIIVVVVIVAILLGLLWSPFFWIGVIFAGWVAYFFRDPARTSPQHPDIVVSPADGQVSAVGPAIPPVELGLGPSPMTRVSVYMNFFDCHVNRAPAAGRVARIAYRPGKFINADLEKASEDNERNGLVIETAHGQLGVVQIAGLVARRILSWTAENAELVTGQRFGMIRFGSRLDVYLPAQARVLVAVGQRAIAGETPIADYGTMPAGWPARVD